MRRNRTRKPDPGVRIEVLRGEPFRHYLCQCWGHCKHHAKFTVFRNGRKAENLCRHHASELCSMNNLHLPELPDDD